MNMIEVKNMSKNFENKKLFNNFSLEIEENTVHALVGPNGSGKTSLLRILTGLYEEDGGQVRLKGSHAMLLENDYLYEDKTGLENIKLYGLYFGYGLDSYQKYSDLLEITNDLGRNVSTYSKGMKRKLSLLIIVMMNREIIFLDEVTSGVDPISRVEIRKFLDKNAALMALNYKPLWIQLAKKRTKENGCNSHGRTNNKYYGTNGQG